LLAFGDEVLPAVEALFPEFAALPPTIKNQTAIDALYAQYLHRQEQDAQLLQREEQTSIADDLNYAEMPGLSSELALKLARQRPSTLAQAGRIEGMTPAALTLILAHMRKARRKKASA